MAEVFHRLGPLNEIYVTNPRPRLAYDSLPLEHSAPEAVYGTSHSRINEKGNSGN
jgi:hypothetical protein